MPKGPAPQGERDEDSPRVMLVDGDEDFRHIFENCCSQAGYEPLCLSEGLKAPEAAADFEPDLILLSQALPDTSGLEVLDQLHRSPVTKGTPVVVLSSPDVSGESRLEGLRAGAIDDLLVPLSSRELGTRLNRYLVHWGTSNPLQPAEQVDLIRKLGRVLEGAMDGLLEMIRASASAVVDEGTQGEDSDGKLILQCVSRARGILACLAEIRKVRRTRHLGTRDVLSMEQSLEKGHLVVPQHGDGIRLSPGVPLEAGTRPQGRDPPCRDGVTEPEAGSRVLVVDDDEDCRALMRELLEEWGYEVVTVSSGQQALAAALSCQPELVLLELCLPDEDGLRTLVRLREEPATRDIPVVLLSSEGHLPERRIEGLQLGAVDFLPKPVPAAELRLRLRRYVTLRKAAEEARRHRIAHVVRAVAAYLNHALNNLMWTIQLSRDILEMRLQPDSNPALEAIEESVAEITCTITRLRMIQDVAFRREPPDQGDIDLKATLATSEATSWDLRQEGTPH